MKKLLIAMLLLYPLPSLATTYEWTDQSGTVHFTEDLGTVPKKYRKKAKVVGEEENVAPQPPAASEPVAEKPKLQESQKGKKVYGGKDEGAWRKEFATVKRDIQGSGASLRELQARMADTSNMSRSEYLVIQNSIKHEGIRLQGLQKKLQQLEQEADEAGVPKEMRE